MDKKFITIFFVDSGKDSPKHIRIPKFLFSNYKRIAIISLAVVLIFIVLSFANLFIGLSLKNENTFLTGKLDDLKKENEFLDEHKVKDKFQNIDGNMKEISSYLKDRGFIDGFNSNNQFQYSEVNLVNNTDNLLAETERVMNTVRTLPLGFPYYGELSSEYGLRKNPFGGMGGEFHPGVDFKGAKGDEIRATGDGYIKSADWYGGYGNAVVIQHEFGLTTLYGHLSKLNVIQGQFVKAGDVIGYLGSTGRSTGPHVHYEIRKENQDISPVEFLQINNK
jgi:murein DD-endopeptidase MepM/ murein hydrolase activator NlpD